MSETSPVDAVKTNIFNPVEYALPSIHTGTMEYNGTICLSKHNFLVLNRLRHTININNTPISEFHEQFSVKMYLLLRMTPFPVILKKTKLNGGNNYKCPLAK